MFWEGVRSFQEVINNVAGGFCSRAEIWWGLAPPHLEGVWYDNFNVVKCAEGSRGGHDVAKVPCVVIGDEHSPEAVF